VTVITGVVKDRYTCLATSTLGVFDAPAIDGVGAWRGFTAVDLARGHHQRMVQRLPRPVVAPRVKPAPDG